MITKNTSRKEQLDTAISTLDDRFAGTDPYRRSPVQNPIFPKASSDAFSQVLEKPSRKDFQAKASPSGAPFAGRGRGYFPDTANTDPIEPHGAGGDLAVRQRDAPIWGLGLFLASGLFRTLQPPSGV
jgi:hypothetical protein